MNTIMANPASLIVMDTFASSGIILMSVITLMCFIHSKVVMSKVPPSVPWAGLRKEVLSKTRACLREFKAGFRTLNSGYNQVFELFPSPPLPGVSNGLGLQFSRKGLPCVIPDPGFRPLVMVPQEHVVWMCEMPDDVLSIRKTQVPSILGFA